jgi:transcriptional regulator with XRE-family HTH domain
MSKFERLGRLLKDARINKAMTQMDLAEMLGYTSPQFVSNWERGLCSPAFEALPTLARVLSIPKREIIEIILEETKVELEANFLLKSRGKARQKRA